MIASIITLGCRLNQAESALITARLERMGYTVIPYSPQSEPDLLILNSCAVTATAERKARQNIRNLRQKHPNAKLLFTGCACNPALQEIPGLTVVPNRWKSEVETFLQGAEPPQPDEWHDQNEEHKVFTENILTSATERTRANLKIQEGCNNFCAYCIIPYKRGRERSRDLEETLKDFRHLVSLGFQEIVLTGINTCTYNCRGARLNDLLERMLETEGNYRIRIGSTEPGPMLKKIVDVMAKANGKLCEFLHPSLQNGSDTILKRMNRHCLTEEYAEYVQYAREKVPHIHIGTDIITGFPGETEETFEETVAFVEKIRFANIHIFPFSPRKGTAAYTMRPCVPNNLAGIRAEKLNKLKEIFAEEFRGSLLETEQTFLPEQDGIGWTGNYIRVKAPGTGLSRIKITNTDQEIAEGKLIREKGE